MFVILMTWWVVDGASLFHTTPQPTTLNVLRCMSYLYPQPLPPTARSTALQRQFATHSHSLTSRTHTLDRDRIVVPAGWDSWGKIAVLRDGFDAKAWGEAWERDLSSDSGIDSDDEAGTRKLYSSLVQDQGRGRADEVKMGLCAAEKTGIIRSVYYIRTGEHEKGRGGKTRHCILGKRLEGKTKV